MIPLLAHILSLALESNTSTLETSFDTNVHVYASTTFPKLDETCPLMHFANATIYREAEHLHDRFAQKMNTPIDDIWEGDADERTFIYDLHLVHNSSHLLEFYGYEYHYTGGAHGGVHYLTKVFGHNKGDLAELTLDDILLTGWRDFLFNYCRKIFKEERYGYYSYDDLDWDPFQPDHIHIFLLTNEGLLLLFQNYTVSGYDDEPMTLLIPYDKITHLIKPDSAIASFYSKIEQSL